MNLINSITVSAVLLSYGVVLASAAKEMQPHQVEGDDAGGLRRKRHLKKKNEDQTNNVKDIGDNLSKKIKNSKGLDEEDVAFWTRLLMGEKGKQTEIGSLPFVPRPHTPVRPPTESIRTSTPTRRPAPRPVETTAPTNGFTRESPTYTPSIDDVGSNSCGLSSTERGSQIVDNLRVISLPDLFDQNATPQRKALDWIINDDPAKLCPEDSRLVQRYTLAVFYYSTNGDDWIQCSAPEDFDEASITEANEACKLTTSNATTIFPNDLRGTDAWLTADECLWGGLSCHATGTPNELQINVIEFENNGLSGTLPSEIEELSAMRFFALERGSISGPIPNSYGNLASLLLLDFDFNNLDGTLPDSLWKLVALRQLDLNDNNFEGKISVEIGQLKQLRFFQIDNNSMSGTIPSALGDIPNFSLIGLSGNSFEGAMPSKICELRPSPLLTLAVDCDIECKIPECCTSCVPV